MIDIPELDYREIVFQINKAIVDATAEFNWPVDLEDERKFEIIAMCIGVSMCAAAASFGIASEQVKTMVEEAIEAVGDKW